MSWTVTSGPWTGTPWRVVRSSPKSSAGLIRRLQRHPEDVVLLIDDQDLSKWPELHDAGVCFTYSLLDLGWLVYGPKQRTRAINERPVPAKTV